MQTNKKTVPIYETVISFGIIRKNWYNGQPLENNATIILIYLMRDINSLKLIERIKTYFPRRSYKVSNHAVKQMRSRGVTKSALRYNLRNKPLHTAGIK